MKKDLDLKGSIYATAEIQEYWVLDLSAKRLIVFRKPRNCQYVMEQIFVEGEVIPLAFPDVHVLIERLLA